jgi:hypothetical protein
MKVKAFIEHLQDFDPEQEIVFLELGGLYDIILLAISERNDKVEIVVKNIFKEEEKERKIQ